MSYTFLDDVVENTEPMTIGRRFYPSAGKRMLDIVVVVLSLPFVLPILALVWLLILLDGGNGIYSQPRIGVGGRVFKCWKIRTMVLDADAVLSRLMDERPDLAEEWNTNQKLECDPRITWWGQMLRRASLDELPQLLNVLKGDMSLIGPRPFTPEQKQLYESAGSDLAYYRLRPGISGLWQVECRNNGTFQKRIAFDETYATDLTLWSDMRLIFRTILVILRATGK